MEWKYHLLKWLMCWQHINQGIAPFAYHSQSEIGNSVTQMHVPNDMPAFHFSKDTFSSLWPYFRTFKELAWHLVDVSGSCMSLQMWCTVVVGCCHFLGFTLRVERCCGTLALQMVWKPVGFESWAFTEAICTLMTLKPLLPLSSHILCISLSHVLTCMHAKRIWYDSDFFPHNCSHMCNWKMGSMTKCLHF